MKGVLKLNFTLNKEKFLSIDDAFSVLKEDNMNKAACEIIEKSLSSCFKGKFSIRLIDVDPKLPLFMMSIFPEIDTITKIITTVSSDDENKENVVRKLWEKNTSWIIEIDKRILTSQIDFTNRELTALLLHEIGHTIFSNSIPHRITTVLQYEIAVSKMENKILLRDKFFKKILSLPILNACVADNKNKNSIKIEIKADKFAQKMGYTKELSSVLSKIINISNSNNNMDENMRQMTQFSVDTIDQLRKRQDKIVKKNLLSIKESCPSPYINEVITEFYNNIFEDHEDSSVTDGKKFNFMIERADRIINETITTEAFIFGTKKLKRIDPATVDYIASKKNNIQSDGDKIMLISYIHSKLDIIDYYLAILTNQSLSRKYSIPHTIGELQSMKTDLLNLKDEIIDYKLPLRTRGMYIAWPDKYYG